MADADGDGVPDRQEAAPARQPEGEGEPETPAGDAQPAKSKAATTTMFKGMGVGDRQGHAGVKEMQRTVAETGIDCEDDGRFGPETEKAVKRFQRKYGLKADGIVGAKTHRTLKRVMRRTKDLEEAVTARKAAQGGRDFTATLARERAIRAELTEGSWSEAAHPRGRGGVFKELYPEGHPRAGEEMSRKHLDAIHDHYLNYGEGYVSPNLAVDDWRNKYTARHKRGEVPDPHKLTEGAELEEANAGFEAMLAAMVAHGVPEDQAKAILSKNFAEKGGGGKLSKRGDTAKKALELKRMPNGMFAPKGAGQVLKPGQSVSVPHTQFEDDAKKNVPGTVTNVDHIGTATVELHDGPDKGQPFQVGAQQSAWMQKSGQTGPEANYGASLVGQELGGHNGSKFKVTAHHPHADDENKDKFTVLHDDGTSHKVGYNAINDVLAGKKQADEIKPKPKPKKAAPKKAEDPAGPVVHEVGDFTVHSSHEHGFTVKKKSAGPEGNALSSHGSKHKAIQNAEAHAAGSPPPEPGAKQGYVYAQQPGATFSLDGEEWEVTKSSGKTTQVSITAKNAAGEEKEFPADTVVDLGGGEVNPNTSGEGEAAKWAGLDPKHREALAAGLATYAEGVGENLVDDGEYSDVESIPVVEDMLTDADMIRQGQVPTHTHDIEGIFDDMASEDSAEGVKDAWAAFKGETPDENPNGYSADDPEVDQTGEPVDATPPAKAMPKIKDYLDNPALFNSPGRGPTGKMRNFKAMGSVKLKKTIADLEAHGGDPEALAAVKKVAQDKGVAWVDASGFASANYGDDSAMKFAPKPKPKVPVEVTKGTPKDEADAADSKQIYDAPEDQQQAVKDKLAQQKTKPASEPSPLMKGGPKKGGGKGPSGAAKLPETLSPNVGGYSLHELPLGAQFELADGTQYHTHKFVNDPWMIAKPVGGGKAKPFHKMLAPPNVGPQVEGYGDGTATPDAPTSAPTTAPTPAGGSGDLMGDLEKSVATAQAAKAAGKKPDFKTPKPVTHDATANAAHDAMDAKANGEAAPASAGNAALKAYIQAGGDDPEIIAMLTKKSV
jgi:peptidoglycan hydrolase-like protein with peptidoglycan-binding domain